MKVLLINIDSVIPNLALHKCAKYHQLKGDEVIWDQPIFRNECERVYVSCVFTKNKPLCSEWENDPKVLIGGVGYSLDSLLPPEIDAVKPDLSLGFTTRGCIRHCDFCIVPRARTEGKFRIVGDFYSVWDGKSKECVFLDNNILSNKEQFHKVCDQSIKEKVRIEFNQGLDARLLDPDDAIKMSKVKWTKKAVPFAWDNIRDEKKIFEGLDILRYFAPKVKIQMYVIMGFNSSWEEDLYRLNKIRDYALKYNYGLTTYGMRHENVYTDKRYVFLAKWCNQAQFFLKMTLKECQDRYGWKDDSQEYLSHPVEQTKRDTQTIEMFPEFIEYSQEKQ